uniref:N-acetylglucosaminylphosphatidylinositol deacetylase n=1 Tax=Panagrellus redivivus TaxID=6233 RepID=A0A7E4W6W9_PANRE
MIIILTLVFTIGLLLPVLWYFVYEFQRPLPTVDGARCLLLIAHPDDESMFFGPTIRRLTAAGVKIFVFCVSTGNFEGQGQRRKVELNNAVVKLGLSTDNLTILDHQDYQDGCKWETEKLARLVLNHIEKLDCDIVVTFDGYGVSGHSNHIAIFRTLQSLYSNGALPADVQVFILESVNIIRKYSWLLDLLPSAYKSTFRYVSSPSDCRAIFAAMFQHKSQLAWFRYLFVGFSRYAYVNTLKRIPIHRLMAPKLN